MTGGTCPSPAFSLEEVKLFAIFSLVEKTLPFREVILSSSRNLLLLRGTTLSPYPPLGNLPSALSFGKTGLFAFFLEKVTFPTALSFGAMNLPLREKVLFLEEHSLNLPSSFYLGAINLPLGEKALFLEEHSLNLPRSFSLRAVNLPFGEKALFLEEHSLNLPASFSLGAVNLPHNGVSLSATLSLGGMNPSPGEFIFPFRESLIYLENQLCYSIPYCIPFIKFLPNGGFLQTVDRPFFNLSTWTRQYLGTHTFLGESLPAFLDSINALRSKLAVLIKATGGKGSSSTAIASFLSRNLSIPLLILSSMTFLKPQHALVVWFHELWYL